METDKKLRKSNNTPEYNKAYYEKNKERLLGLACAKIACPFCKREVMKNNLSYHKKTALCQRTQDNLIIEQSRNAKAQLKLNQMNN